MCSLNRFAHPAESLKKKQKKTKNEQTNERKKKNKITKGLEGVGWGRCTWGMSDSDAAQPRPGWTLGGGVEHRA